MIKITNITKNYGKKQVLKDFNLNINKGEIIAITGESGSGKSTILNILGLIENFDYGEYKIFENTNIKVNTNKSQNIIKEKINYLFQNYALVDNETVEQNLLLAMNFIKGKQEIKKQQIKDVLEDLGLDDYHKYKISELSGGEQQRVALARVILKPCEIILADEPTGNLDENNKQIVIKQLQKLNQQGKTIIISTHDKDLANIATKIINLKKLS